MSLVQDYSKEHKVQRKQTIIYYRLHETSFTVFHITVYYFFLQSCKFFHKVVSVQVFNLWAMKNFLFSKVTKLYFLVKNAYENIS